VKVGDQIAGYEIVAKLASGGMATVFLGKRARAAGFAKHVAIKVVHHHLAEDPAFIEMFLDEARLHARIEHPNVVQVHDLGESEGSYFIVMEHVAGCSLAGLLRVLSQQ
jgi:serine/threonine-protein kinase